MRDLMGMMGKVKEMQEKMASLQEEVEALECEGTSGGGLVTVRLNGKGMMLAGESGDFFTQQSPVLGSPHPMPPYVA